MKIYVKNNGITFVGKAWQIKYMIKHYMKSFDTVADWIAAENASNSK
jgi:hypothetical protein